MSHAKSHFLSTYLKAIANEANGDEHISGMLELGRYTKHAVIRPAYLIKFIKKFPGLFNFMYWIALRCWWLLNLTISSGKLLIILRAYFRLNASKAARPGIIGRTFALIATPRVIQQLQLLEESEVPETWIYIPGIHIVQQPGKQQVQLLQLLNLKDLFQAFFFSVHAPTLVKRETKNKYMRLQTYISMEWHMTYTALHKICTPDTTILFGNHYDRWAVLFNELPSREKIMLQHGLEDGSVIFPNKITNVTKLVCYDPKQKIFFHEILGKTDFDIAYYRSSISLTTLSAPFSYSILIIGNIALYKELEAALVTGLSSCSLNLYLKPHPVFPVKDYNQFFQHKNFRLIENKTEFPLVDLVVSYESTLAYEYMSTGINVLFYQDRTADELIELIKQQMPDNFISP